MEAIGPALILLSIPLAFRWVPRNRIYGFRMSATLASDAIWYDVNARCAMQFAALGVAMVALEFVLPLGMRNQVLAAIGGTGVPVIAIANWRRASRLARELRH